MHPLPGPPRPTIPGITTDPNAAFVAQVARNLTDHADGFLRGKRFLIVDRDSKFTHRFFGILGDAGVEIVRTAFQAREPADSGFG